MIWLNTFELICAAEPIARNPHKTNGSSALFMKYNPQKKGPAD
jgi:hypothetical protein